ncbi:hypothetical protein [Bacillus seohaeanensis]|uniref:Uncharacterized protein n=1 Tax=Bacillus seohaeanensis TaxID=284580 RepID=A0ABW5RQW5_9BACI
MLREKELDDFVLEGRFELNAYLHYLFCLFHPNVRSQSKDKMVKQRIKRVR